MIFRDKFVSNSSSSSFIVHKLDIGEDKFNKLSNFFIDNFPYNSDPSEEEYWGDSGITYSIDKNFIVVETFHAPREVHKALYGIIPEFDKVSICLY